ncbi:nitroreductase family deazaflavin-dependent oxidoreductase [Mycobacterium sp. ITM-2016-00317]|uniref:nitroreductase family deazaflavin-dependent oxidoreductase n=1 Tax=Mycobacterium sp. ITM-2016-00317 TaxID=2099694 RepID=UPI000D462680|nr:nitroreductase family deazaflavin-dependent oxidoreductase [Mycobacterium sp. ITM-2016-00317]WNG88407.1 nitroreductase family deazaflavin-dependent oxidoreductase [Mycobacterium sp. ITM-2016-00317]
MVESERVRPPWWLKYVNKVMIAVNRTGLFTGGPAVLEVTGRKSGKPRKTPVTPFEVDGRRYVVGGLPGADWVRNLQADPDAVLLQGKRRERVRMVEVPVDQARPLLRQFPVLVPTGVDFMKSAGLVTGPNPDEFEALAGRCAVFRFDSV